MAEFGGGGSFRESNRPPAAAVGPSHKTMSQREIVMPVTVAGDGLRLQTESEADPAKLPVRDGTRRR
jgi:hypothetical protein